MVDVARVSTDFDVALLLTLGSVRVRHYRRLRSKHTLGMLAFATMLLLENVFALHIHLVDPTLSGWFTSKVPDVARRATLTLHVLETLGIASPTWVTMD